MINKSYIVAYTIFPKGYIGFKTKFKVFNDYKWAYNFYKSLMTENKCFYIEVFKEELEIIKINNNEANIFTYEELLDKVLDLQNKVLKLQEERDKNLDSIMFLSKVADKKQDIIDISIKYIDTELIPYGEECHWDDYGIKDHVLKLRDKLQGGNK